MAKRKKKRTSIRTAAGTTQELFLGRLRDLAANPLKVLPDAPFGEPAPLAKVRKGLEKVVSGKVGLLMKRDKGVVGAVWQSMQLAELDAAPRLMDHKVDGKRRFYLVRGHVKRSCLLGVQNHDDAKTLLMAYRDMAKDSGLHFFADTELTCSGDRPVPPDSWWDFVADKLGIVWEDHRCRTCPHPDRGLVELTFPDGPGVAVCGNCAKDVGSLHKLVAVHYAGPRQRTPFHIHLMPNGIDGDRIEAPRELAAAYRAGIETEKSLLAKS